MVRCTPGLFTHRQMHVRPDDSRKNKVDHFVGHSVSRQDSMLLGFLENVTHVLEQKSGTPFA